MKHPALGTLSPGRFLRRHWQKKPLFVRAAVPDLEHQFSAAELIKLACRDDVESRLVTHARGRWNVAHGPFTRRALTKLPARGWSLLVQGVELHLPAARALLDRFNFIPYARHDDLMLSFAPPGSGVGPHFDSYDVILVQARGRRRWRIGAQADLALVQDAPLRILRSFRPQQEIVVEPGDLLYLPPHYAHEGVALSDCITCSVGFRAPSKQEIASGFLQWLQESATFEGRYRDPRLTGQLHPAEISSPMVAQIETMLRSIKWSRRAVEQFLGEHLTEPKGHVWFEAPPRPLSFTAFMRHARGHGIRLGMKSRMLFRGRRVFINGDSVSVPLSARDALVELADRREALPWRSGSVSAAREIYAWYRNGYVELA